MNLVVMYSQSILDDSFTEYDACTACGHVTKSLVWFRLDQVLVGLCGKCIDVIKLGYEEMLKRRAAFAQTNELPW